VGSTIDNVREVACVELLVMLIHQAAFDTLRTSEQLGYTIGAQAYRAWSAQAVLLYARSDTASSDYLDERFEAFLAAHAHVLRNTTQQTLDKMREALVTNLGMRDHSLAERTGRLWSEIEMHDCIFDRASLLQAEARTLTLADAVGLYERVFLNPDTRRKLALWVRAPGEDKRPTPKRAGRADLLKAYTRITPEGLDAWRAGCELLPAPSTCEAFGAGARAAQQRAAAADDIDGARR
jgi:secreted Zn-dependent insulinase-like peptidase